MLNKKSTKKTPAAPSILIILMGSLGDVARGLCLVSHIKDHLPDSRVSWLIEARRIDLVNFHPQLDKIIVFDRSKGAAGVWDLYQALRREHFDVTLDLQRIFKSGLFSLLSGARRRIGFHRRNSKEFNWLFNNEYIPYFRENLSKLDHYLKLPNTWACLIRLIWSLGSDTSMSIRWPHRLWLKFKINL